MSISSSILIVSDQWRRLIDTDAETCQSLSCLLMVLILCKVTVQKCMHTYLVGLEASYLVWAFICSVKSRKFELLIVWNTEFELNLEHKGFTEKDFELTSFDCITMLCVSKQDRRRWDCTLALAAGKCNKYQNLMRRFVFLFKFKLSLKYSKIKKRLRESF